MTTGAGNAITDIADSLPARIAAGALGVSVPLVVFGKGAIAPTLAFVVAYCLFLLREPGYRQSMLNGLRSPIGCATGVVILVFLASSLVSIDVVKSLETWGRTLAILFLGALIFQFLRRAPRLQIITVRYLIFAALLAQTYALYNFLLGDIAEAVRIFAGIEQPFQPSAMFKLYASVLVCLLPIIVWHSWRWGGYWRIVALLIVPSALPVILGGGFKPSHSAMAGLGGGAVLVMLVLLGIKLPRLARRGLVAGLVVLGICAAGYVFSQLPPPPVVADQVPPLPFPDWHRQVIWGFVFDVFKSNPVIGVGVNAVDMVDGAKAVIPGMNQEYIPSHPHNWVLEIAAETGVAGLIAMASCLLTVLWMLIRHAANGRIGAWPGLFFFGTFWTSALSNFSIWAAWWDMTFVVLLAIVLAGIGNDANAGSNADKTP